MWYKPSRSLSLGDTYYGHITWVHNTQCWAEKQNTGLNIWWMKRIYFFCHPRSPMSVRTLDFKRYVQFLFVVYIQQILEMHCKSIKLNEINIDLYLLYGYINIIFFLNWIVWEFVFGCIQLEMFVYVCAQCRCSVSILLIYWIKIQSYGTLYYRNTRRIKSIDLFRHVQHFS